MRRLAGLEAAGRRQREHVHRILKSRAYEPLAVIGPEIYKKVLGEKITVKAVHVSGATEVEAAGSGQSLLDFFGKRAAAGTKVK